MKQAAEIKTKKELLRTVEYITGETIRLKNKYIKEKGLAIDYLTIFSHSNKEFQQCKRIMQNLGKIIYRHNGPTYLLEKPIKLPIGELKILRIRKPDRERPQIGCDDFKVADFKKFKQKYLTKDPKHIIFSIYPTFEMFEIKNTQFNVLAYIPSEPLTTYLKI